MRFSWLVSTLAMVSTSAIALAEQPSASQKQHAISIYGDVKYPATFTHFDYTNPAAPKGGELHLATTAPFDSLNPYIVKGTPAPGLTFLGTSFLHCSLAAQAEDEPATYYGAAAESFEVAPDHTWVTFNLNPKARFSDGTPLTADDVIFTFDTLKKEGHPLYATYYKNIERVEKRDALTLTFYFKDNTNRELPLILAQLPVLSKKFFEKNAFQKTSLIAPVGCGPYTIKSMEEGRSITYERIKDWWGENVPAFKGQYNFDTIRYDVYRDLTVLFEAFKTGAIDLYVEPIAKNWMTGYDIPAVAQGHIIRQTDAQHLPIGVVGFLMNLRREPFKDPRVRQALIAAFDFEWANTHLFYGLYQRIHSYFTRTNLEAKGTPSAEELVLLTPFKEELPAEVFGSAYQPPVSDQSGHNRKNLVQAHKLLEAAGYRLQNGQLMNAKGQPFVIQMMLDNAAYERVAQNYQQTLKRLGITLTYRVVDAAQYQDRIDRFDYDMIYSGMRMSDTPGNELRDFFGSTTADRYGSLNMLGIKSSAVDALIERAIHAKTYEELKTAINALDRVLTYMYALVPAWYSDEVRYAYWDKFARPKVKTRDGVGALTWWYDAERAKRLKSSDLKSSKKGSKTNP